MSRLSRPQKYTGARCGNPPFVSDRRMIEEGFARHSAGHTALLRSDGLTQLRPSLSLGEPTTK